jgi:hypothetical protein
MGIGGARRGKRTRRGRQFRNSSVGRVEDDRRPAARHDLRVVLALPDHVVVVDVLFRLAVLDLLALLRVRLGLGRREELLGAEIAVALERCVRGVGPVAREIRLTVGQSRHRPRLLLRRYQRGSRNHRQHCEEDSPAHRAPPLESIAVNR